MPVLVFFQGLIAAISAGVGCIGTHKLVLGFPGEQ